MKLKILKKFKINMSYYPENKFLLGDEEKIIMKPFHYEMDDNWRKREKGEIHMWCKDKDSKTTLLRIVNFPYIVCVELPEEDKEKNKIIWK